MAANQTRAPIELALPTGVFCRIRPATMLDKLLASDGAKAMALVYVGKEGEENDKPSEGGLFVAILISRLCLFDDQKRTPLEVLDMDSRDTDAICQHLLPFLSGPVR